MIVRTPIYISILGLGRSYFIDKAIEKKTKEEGATVSACLLERTLTFNVLDSRPQSADSDTDREKDQPDNSIPDDWSVVLSDTPDLKNTERTYLQILYDMSSWFSRSRFSRIHLDRGSRHHRAGDPVEKGLSVESDASIELPGSPGRERRHDEEGRKEVEDNLREGLAECEGLGNGGPEKGVSVEDLRKEIRLAQDKLREAETGKENCLLDLQEKLHISETERNKLAVSNSEKEQRINDLQTRLEALEQEHTATINELNEFKAQIPREKEIKRPLNYNPTLNILDVQGEFLLYRAAAEGDYAVVKKLLEQGANPNFRTRFQWTSLHWAVGNGHYEVAKLLLEYGASPTAQSDTGATPVSMAGTEEMRLLLTEHEA